MPEPVRKNRTMAYYAPSTVERVISISEMQRQGMSLSQIRELMTLKDNGVEIDSIIMLHQALFRGKTEPLMDKGQFCEATGLDPAQLKTLIDAGLLLPKEPGMFNQEDVTACKFYLWGFSKGIKIEDLQIIQTKIKEIVESRVEMSDRLTADMPVEKAAETKLYLMKSVTAVQTYLGQRIFHNKLKKRSNRPNRENLVR